MKELTNFSRVRKFVKRAFWGSLQVSISKLKIFYPLVDARLTLDRGRLGVTLHGEVGIDPQNFCGLGARFLFANHLRKRSSLVHVGYHVIGTEGRSVSNDPPART